MFRLNKSKLEWITLPWVGFIRSTYLQKIVLAMLNNDDWSFTFLPTDLLLFYLASLLSRYIETIYFLSPLPVCTLVILNFRLIYTCSFSPIDSLPDHKHNSNFSWIYTVVNFRFLIWSKTRQFFPPSSTPACFRLFVQVFYIHFIFYTSFSCLPSARSQWSALRAGGSGGQRLGLKSLSSTKNHTGERYLLSLYFFLSK